VATASGARLTALELATGVAPGIAGWAPPLPRAHGETPLEAIAAVIAPALARPPCLVSFSGGVDSSTVLSLAAHIARREGLPAPIPATNRFPGHERTDEREWQELVVQRLGLTEWIRLDFSDELDVVGPIASALLRARGPVFPFNMHFHVPLIEAAAGGSLLTGIGGDEAFEPAPRVQQVLAGRRRPRPRDALALALAYAPRSARAFVWQWRQPRTLPWLTAAGTAQLTAALAADDARYPAHAGKTFGEWWRSRYLHLHLVTQLEIAAAHDCHVVNPLSEARAVTAFGAAAGRFGFATRGDAVRALFGEVVPSDVTLRRTKADFNTIFWHRHARAFVVQLTVSRVRAALAELGAGELVDAERLLDAWRSPDPHASSYLLLQAVWAREASHRVIEAE
jgi:asparagine synthetase B (glutamine-hydrolysing)